MQSPFVSPTQRLTASISSIVAAWLLPSAVHAVSGNWTATAGGSWGTAASWSSNPTIPGSAAGDVININSNIAAAATINLDANRTVGTLLIGDSNTSHGFTLASGTGTNLLILDQTATGTALVRFGVSGGVGAIANTISAGITLNDNARFYTTLTTAQTLSGVITGAKSVTFDNDDGVTAAAAVSLQGQFTVSGANTYSGGTTIDDVRVIISTSNAALGTGAVTILDGGTVYNSSGLTAIANTFNINGNGWVETSGQLGALRLEGASIVTGNVVLQSNAAIGSNTGTGAVTGSVNGVVSGGFALTKVGLGTLALGGTNTFSGGLVIANGAVQLNNNAGAGTGAISFATGGATNHTRLFVNGGVTAANAININAATFGVGGNNGVLQQTGTGLATLTGAINVTASPTAGGHFVGGNVATNALVLSGAITSSVPLGHRDGFVRYSGGGTGYSTLNVTGTAQVGAVNGIATTATLQVGASANATLDLNGFNQTLVALSLGNATANLTNTGTLALGGNTLTLNGDLTGLNTGTGNVTNVITGTLGSGTIDFGAVARNLVVADNSAPDDLRITGATLLTTAGLSKTGAGTLALSGATLTGPVTISAGAVRSGTINTIGSFSADNITFNNGTTLEMKVAVAGDSINAGTFVNAGTTNLVLNQFGGLLANGTYPLINYTGATPGTAGFNLTVGHAAASLFDTGTSIALVVTGNESIIWDGTNTTAWATGATGNWKLTGGAPTDFITSDAAIFNDAPTSSTVAVAANVSPSVVTFNNTTATDYTVTGTGVGIIGSTGLFKTGNGILNLGGAHQYNGATSIASGTLNLTGSLANSNVSVASGATLAASGTIGGLGVSLTSSGTTTLSGTNTYTGATTVNAGTATVIYSGVTLPAVSAVTVASGATLKLTHTGGVFGLVNPISGAGTIVLDPSTTTAAARDITTVTWNATGFTGLLNLKPTLGTMRMTVDNPTDLGSATVQVDSGGQLFFNTANQTYANNISIAGTGFSETAGTLGAIRAGNTTTFTGVITLAANAKIGALGGTAISTNSITGTGTQVLTVGGSINSASGETLAVTGTVSNLASITVNDGSATSAATSVALNVGNNSATGTIGSIPVNLNPDGFKNAVVRFDRTDGYTLGAAVTTIGGTPANYVRSFVDADSQGTGFSDGGFAINLGGSTATTGGLYRVGTNRANSFGNITGTLTSGQVVVGASAAGTGAALNLNTGGTINTDVVFVGNVANVGGTVTQATGSTFNIGSQLRVGNATTETGVYNMNGGALNLTGASPANTPSQAVAGAASAVGDGNLSVSATFPTYSGGGIYIGVDGQGVFNHTAGTVTTNWIVLDTRGASGTGANMVDGLDRYSISGSSILNLRSTYGLIARNDASALVTLGGGTIKVDNGGTGTGTGTSITIPLDATLVTTAATTTTLDTNGAGNGISILKDVTGTGTLNLTGGGNINLSTTGVQAVSANISGTAPLVKLGAGSTSLLGSASSYTGNVTVSAGLLNVPTNLGAGNITVADGAAVSGESLLVNTLTFGTTTGGTIFINPNTPGALTTTNLVINGANLIDLTASPAGAGPYTVINYTSKSGAGTFAAANAASYRVAPTVNDTGSAITLDITGRKDLTWTGAASTAWNINSAINWNDTVSAPETFFTSDNVTFPEGAANTSIALTGLLAPNSLTVNAATTAYTFTSTTGNQITGSTGITKTGNGSLTLTGPNLYTGLTSIGGGTVIINGATSLGSGVIGNSIAISGGGRLSYNAATAMDLGLNRNIAVGTGGGSISHNNATGASITIPGNLTGSGTDNLSFHSAAAGAGTFVLTGDNSGYTGKISVDSLSTTAAILRLGTQSAVPASGSISLNYPANAANGVSTSLDLPAPGRTLPAGLTLNFTSFHTPANVSLRSGMTTGIGNSIINGPITLAGSAVIQFNAASPGTVTYNGTITETTPGSYAENVHAFSNVVFFRGNGTHTINNTINLPSTGSTIAVTDGATLIINSTGNVFKSASAAFGTLRLGVNDALSTTGRLVIGQQGDQAATLDLNGFNQTVAGLEWQAPTGNLLTKGISNSHLTATSTFTINQATAPTATNFNGTLSGKINLVKDGAADVSLIAPASTFTGNITVNAGKLSATGVGANNGANGTLGNASVAGRIITVNNTGTLSLLTNNIFGNGIANANLPAVVINAGGTVSATRFNVLGDVTLNGGLLTQASTDGPTTWEGYELLGGVTVGGSVVSTMTTTNGKGNHLGTNTAFNVANATADALPDLIVSVPLLDRSNSFASAAGGFTKTGVGTMQLAAVNTYTGPTSVSGGTLLLGVSNALPDLSTLSLSTGTTLATGGFTDNIGALTLNSGVTIDMGANVSGSVLTFSDVSAWSGILSIWNYTGAGYTPGTDKLIFSANIGNINLANVNFYSDNGITPYDIAGGAAIVGGTELVPVPEPSAIAGALGLLGLLGYRERRGFLHFRR